jgi:hypothetical protein
MGAENGFQVIHTKLKLQQLIAIRTRSFNISVIISFVCVPRMKSELRSPSWSFGSRSFNARFERAFLGFLLAIEVILVIKSLSELVPNVHSTGATKVALVNYNSCPQLLDSQKLDISRDDTCVFPKNSGFPRK